MSAFKRFLFRVFRKNETEIHELNYLFWECTWRCNLACRHCGSDCKSESNVKDMPFADFLHAIEPLEQRYPRDTVIFGNHTERILYCNGGTIAGLTISNGYNSASGGGAYCRCHDRADKGSDVRV